MLLQVFVLQKDTIDSHVLSLCWLPATEKIDFEFRYPMLTCYWVTIYTTSVFF